MGPVSSIDSRHMRGNFSTHAGEYDLYAEVQKRVVSHLAARIPASAGSAGLILDVGTGTGALAEAVGKVRGESLVVMDIAHGMTRQARERLPQTLPCDGDARALPFGGESFAMVLSSSVYQWVECLDSAFAEVARVLRPGGLFALALFGEQTLCELRGCHRRAAAEQGRGRGSHVQNFPSRDEVDAALGAAGLRCDRIASSMEVEYHPDVPTLLRRLKHIGAGNASATRPRGLASRQVMQRMIALYEAEHGTERGIPASYEVLIALARKC